MRQWTRSHTDVRDLVDRLGPGPWTRSELIDAGWSVEKVRAAEHAGRIVRLRRGHYAVATVTSHERWQAALRAAGPDAVLSHESAALLHGLWLPRRPPSGVQVTRSGGIERHHAGLRVHGSRLTAEHVTDVAGIPVTTIARTAMDVARGCSLPEAMVVVDSAARAIIGTVSDEDLRVLRSFRRRAELTQVATQALWAAFDSVRTWPGSVAARGAVLLVEPASESPYESLSRGWIREANLPTPLVAYGVSGASGAEYVADFGWEDRRLLAEVDGMSKYGATSEQVAVSLRAERRREQDLRDAGWELVRWNSGDGRRVVLQRLKRALTDR